MSNKKHNYITGTEKQKRRKMNAERKEIKERTPTATVKIFKEKQKRKQKS